MGFGNCPPRYVVQRIAGPQTCPGPGDILVDNLGNRYREVDRYEAQMIRQGTAGSVATLYPNGTIS